MTLYFQDGGREPVTSFSHQSAVLTPSEWKWSICLASAMLRQFLSVVHSYLLH